MMKLVKYISRILKAGSTRPSLSCLVIASLSLTSCEEGRNKDYVVIPPPVEFTADIPVDVDPALQAKLKSEKNYYELNEAFNKYSWQAFVAIQWPLDSKGNPTKKFTDKGTPKWLGWKEAFQVYMANGHKPASWGSPRKASGLGIETVVLKDIGSRIMLSGKTPTHVGNFNIADEIDQAFAGELFDQNGNLVVYEVLMNKAEFDYVMNNSLYNINGQIIYSAKNNSLVNFPKGDYDTGTVGAIEIKFAWKVLENNDIKERYFRDEGYVVEVVGKESLLVKKDLGMIGMHISQKTPTGSQWVWSTFEHIDNLNENEVDIDGQIQRIHPTLRDPNCEICPANVDLTKSVKHWFVEDKDRPHWTVVTKNPDTKSGKPYDTTLYYASYGKTPKTQSKRMVDIPVRVTKINAEMQEYFKRQNSVWQYYQLIDTQYPMDQNEKPAPNLAGDYVLPNSVTNKSGGNPNIALLTNITMETFFQSGNQVANNLTENNLTGSEIQVFGTESCIGCHSSAAIYNGYYIKNDSLSQAGQLSGDFSWLLGKARWNKDSSDYPKSQPE